MLFIYNWQIWKPEIVGTLKLDNIQDAETFQITINHNEKSKIKLNFDGYLISYRVILSNFRKKTLGEFKQHFNISNGMFVTKKSEYKDRLNEGTKGWPVIDDFIHNLYITENYVIDVICNNIPEITIT